MSGLASVRVTVTVDVAPDVAFKVFTAEFDEWYRSGSAALGPRETAGRISFEPGPDGRLVETRPGQPPRVLARITEWQPGERLTFIDRRETEVDVTFNATDGGATRVVLEHRRLDRLPPDSAADIAKYGWRRLAGWFETHVAIGQPATIDPNKRSSS